MPDPTPPPPRELHSIVVLGAMNPRLHHPQWYREIGAIDETELQSALSETMNVTPTFTQFQFGNPPIVISSQADFWQIQLTEEKLWPRMVEMASIVFAKLDETPVSAFALNTQLHRDTSATDVKALIARVLVNLNFGLPTGKSEGADMTVNAIEDDYTVAMSVQASLLSERAVFVFYQSQYPTSAAARRHFELGSLLKARVDGYLAKSRTAIDNAVSAINTLAAK
jgi:hypothetical protein